MQNLVIISFRSSVFQYLKNAFRWGRIGRWFATTVTASWPPTRSSRPRSRRWTRCSRRRTWRCSATSTTSSTTCPCPTRSWCSAASALPASGATWSTSTTSSWTAPGSSWTSRSPPLSSSIWSPLNGFHGSQESRQSRCSMCVDSVFSVLRWGWAVISV